MRSKSCGSIHRQNQGLCDSKVLLRGAVNVFLAYMGTALRFGDWLINSNNNSDMLQSSLRFCSPKELHARKDGFCPQLWPWLSMASLYMQQIQFLILGEWVPISITISPQRCWIFYELYFSLEGICYECIAFFLLNSLNTLKNMIMLLTNLSRLSNFFQKRK